MINSSKIELNALKFVNLLAPGHFEEANLWLAPSCEYEYQGKQLKGSEIIKCFLDNHNKNTKELDEVKYLGGSIEKVEGPRVSILGKDEITVGGLSYIYTDRLVITCNNSCGYGSVEKIEHVPVEGEIDKLTKFFEANQIQWE